MNVNTTVCGGVIEKSVVGSDVLTVTFSTVGSFRMRSRVEIRDTELIKKIVELKLDQPGSYMNVTGKTMIDPTTDQLVFVADKAQGSVNFLKLENATAAPAPVAKPAAAPAAPAVVRAPAAPAPAAAAPRPAAVAATPAVTARPAAATIVKAPATVPDDVEPPANTFTGLQPHEDFPSTVTEDEAQKQVDALIAAGILAPGTRANLTQTIPF